MVLFYFFGSGGWMRVLLEVPQIIITKAYDVYKIYGCIFWGWGWGWGGHGKHPKLILQWPMHVSMHYSLGLNQFDSTNYSAFW